MATAITGTRLWFLGHKSFGHCPHWLPWLLKVKLFSTVLKNAACSLGSCHVGNKNVRRSVFGLKVYTGKNQSGATWAKVQVVTLRLHYMSNFLGNQD